MGAAASAARSLKDLEDGWDGRKLHNKHQEISQEFLQVSVKLGRNCIQFIRSVVNYGLWGDQDVLKASKYSIAYQTAHHPLNENSPVCLAEMQGLQGCFSLTSTSRIQLASWIALKTPHQSGYVRM